MKTMSTDLVNEGLKKHRTQISSNSVQTPSRGENKHTKISSTRGTGLDLRVENKEFVLE